MESWISISCDRGKVIRMQMARPDLLSRISRLILLGAAVLLLVPQGAPAHSPTDMQLAFDQGDRILSVTITHPVADPSTHYIKRILITTGGSTITDTAYTSQPSPVTFTYTYLMPQSVNGEIQVKGECSIIGSITRSIQVQQESPRTTGTPGASPPTSATTPARAGPGFLLITTAVALAVWRFGR
jgi:hypothetical protein